MEAAIEQARIAAEKGDYAIGCVIEMEGKIISRGHDSLKSRKDPTQHAEIIAIQDACRKLGRPYLEGCIAYVTVEPCPMCAGASIWAKLGGIVFGATLKDLREHSRKKGSKKFTWRTINLTCEDVIETGTPKMHIKKGFMRKECIDLFGLSK